MIDAYPPRLLFRVGDHCTDGSSIPCSGQQHCWTLKISVFPPGAYQIYELALLRFFHPSPRHIPTMAIAPFFAYAHLSGPLPWVYCIYNSTSASLAEDDEAIAKQGWNHVKNQKKSFPPKPEKVLRSKSFPPSYPWSRSLEPRLAPAFKHPR